VIGPGIERSPAHAISGLTLRRLFSPLHLWFWYVAQAWSDFRHFRCFWALAV